MGEGVGEGEVFEGDGGVPLLLQRLDVRDLEGVEEVLGGEDGGVGLGHLLVFEDFELKDAAGPGEHFCAVTVGGEACGEVLLGEGLGAAAGEEFGAGDVVAGAVELGLSGGDVALVAVPEGEVDAGFSEAHPAGFGAVV